VSLLFGRTEQRAVSFQDVYGTGGDVTMYGQQGTGLVALYAAHREIVDAVSSVPLHGYRERPDGTVEQLARDPGIITPPVGTVVAWKAAAVMSLLYDGNAFGIPTGLDGAWPARLRWIDPRDVDVDDDAPLPVYRVGGKVLSAERGEIVHVPWLVPPGRWRGISPLRKFMTTWETGVAAQQSARDWFKHGAIPSGHLRNVARRLTRDQANEAKAIFRAAVEGRDVLATGNDWTYAPIGVPANEQRFVEGIKMTSGQVAAVYGLPPEDVGGEAANSLTYATQESNERRRAQRVAAPWCIRLEQALTLQTPRPQYVRFNLDATVRADLKTRMEAHAIAMDTGLETLDEARALEDKAPLTDEQWSRWQAWQQARRSAPQAPAQTREGDPTA